MVGIKVAKALDLNQAPNNCGCSVIALIICLCLHSLSSVYREAEVEEVKEPVDPAVRAKENWLRLFNKVRQQLQEVGL